MRLCVLLGSGSSMGAGYPSVESLTKDILSDRNYEFYSDMRSLVPPNPGLRNTVKHCQHFLSLLQNICDTWLFKRGISDLSSNYEHLAYVVEQLMQDQTCNIENPLLEPFIEKFQRENEAFISDVSGLPHIASITWNYVLLRVQLALRPRDGSELKHLASLLDAMEDPDVEIKAIATLNHDLLLDSSLTARGIGFTDGFAGKRQGISPWNSNLLWGNDSDRKLLKLHGSIDWYEIVPQGASGYQMWKGSFPARLGPQGHSELEATSQETLGPPILLVGTYNKQSHYAGNIFIDLHAKFSRELEESDLLLVIGYGFRDQGINRQIIEWADRKGSSGILVIDPYVDRLEQTALPAIGKHWKHWERDSILQTIPSKLEDLAWTDIKSAVSQNTT